MDARSLDFDTNLLALNKITIGSGVFGGFNTNQATNGHIGMLLESDSNTFAPGAQVLAQVTFQTAFLTKASNATISFSSSVTTNQVTDSNAVPVLPVAYLPGAVAISAALLEGDVSPRPGGDEQLTTADWVQEGRFVAGLDSATNATEMLRADCAPRGTGGDGVLDTADWVQVGRYVLGLDPITAVSNTVGSSVVVHKATPATPTRQLTSRTLSLTNLSPGVVSVQLAAMGNEAALGFSLSFDPNNLTFVSGSLGTGANGAKLFLNTTNIAAGQLGVTVGFLGSSFAAGNQQVATLNFGPVVYSNAAQLVFTNSPVAPSMADTSADDISSTVAYVNSAVVVGGAAWPSLNAAASGGNLNLSWPSTATNFTVQSTTNLGANWTTAIGNFVTNGSSVTFVVSPPTNTTFYRLIQP